MPELAGFDKKYIYEPHKAPMVDQRKYGCTIKGDGTETEDGGTPLYPKPMFDFNERREFCIDKIKAAYNMKVYGDDESVLSGRWKSMFKFDDTGAKQKDEMDGYINGVQGSKRSRDAEDEEHDREGGADINNTDATAGEPSKKSPKKSDKVRKGQPTLDSMVTRKKGKS